MLLTKTRMTVDEYLAWADAEVNDRIGRYRLSDGAVVPTGQRETILSGLPLTGDHPMHPSVIDPQGNLFVDLGSGDQFLPSRTGP